MVSNRLGLIWLLIGGIGLGAGLASVVLTEWLHLDPCHLCIFQRLLMLVVGIFALSAAASVWRGWNPLVPGGLTFLTTEGGVAVAAHHSWIQAYPSPTNSCVSSDPGLIETLVEWLGQQIPSLFLATGFCEDDRFRLLGLPLATISLLLFTALTTAALWALWHTWRIRSRNV
ncbi:disulfide bond formation protein DsbB [Allochromatium warmingii]|uniref:Disulfide bond formation protein DsbB n=1 Tax=Allochromatium warmingii TaxID=61595 RepID=A0A1H3F5H0_ALLWA|nr:disulfide bond formation protein B [Allochromatium warmingii]SDX86263.1 disulfide bond formation protein DsbB [Allochromatium warmingii]